MDLSDIQYHLRECDSLVTIVASLWQELLIPVKRGVAVRYVIAARRRGRESVLEA